MNTILYDKFYLKRKIELIACFLFFYEDNEINDNYIKRSNFIINGFYKGKEPKLQFFPKLVYNLIASYCYKDIEIQYFFLQKIN